MSASNPNSLFSYPREIVSGLDIPVIDPREDPDRPRAIQLIRTSNERNHAYLERHGARRGKGGWRIERAVVFPFEQLERFLPKFAQRSLVPEVVDLIPPMSWFASLANMLVGSSWDRLRLPVIEYAGGCQDCGGSSNLEGHEYWTYDASSLVQTLKGIKSLCSQCHEAQHLGRANVTGRFPVVFERLCRVNRIKPGEREVFRNAIFNKFLARADHVWGLDVSAALIGDEPLVLKKCVEYAGDNWVVQPATASREEMAAQIVNADVMTDSKRLVIVRRS